jgi:hypothetical protein
MAVLHVLLSLIGQLTGVWQSVATPSGLLAVGALVLAGLLALAVARMAATAAALTVAPMRRRAAAIRQKSWSARFQRLTDPDAAGRVRPRAPGAVPAAARLWPLTLSRSGPDGPVRGGPCGRLQLSSMS